MRTEILAHARHPGVHALPHGRPAPRRLPTVDMPLAPLAATA